MHSSHLKASSTKLEFNKYAGSLVSIFFEIVVRPGIDVLSTKYCLENEFARNLQDVKMVYTIEICCK